MLHILPLPVLAPALCCSIVACTEGLASYILLASYGSGAAELEKNVVMKGADWSPFLLDSHTNHIYYSVEDDDQAKTLPEVRAHALACCADVCTHGALKCVTFVCPEQPDG
jgi:hypothetical protein